MPGVRKREILVQVTLAAVTNNHMSVFTIWILKFLPSCGSIIPQRLHPGRRREEEESSPAS